MSHVHLRRWEMGYEWSLNYNGCSLQFASEVSLPKKHLNSLGANIHLMLELEIHFQASNT